MIDHCGGSWNLELLMGEMFLFSAEDRPHCSDPLATIWGTTLLCSFLLINTRYVRQGMEKEKEEECTSIHARDHYFLIESDPSIAGDRGWQLNGTLL